MSVSSVSDLSRQHLLSILSGNPITKQSAQLATSTLSSATAASSSSSPASSPFAQMLTELQQLEQANPGQYAKLAHQISTNLSSAASKAQGQGNASLANQLTALSNDFATSSASAATSGGGTSSSSNPFQFVGGLLGKVAGL